jgi:hypothetical protein
MKQMANFDIKEKDQYIQRKRKSYTGFKMNKFNIRHEMNLIGHLLNY